MFLSRNNTGQIASRQHMDRTFQKRRQDFRGLRARKHIASSLTPVDKTLSYRMPERRCRLGPLQRNLIQPAGRLPERATPTVLVIAAHPDDEILGGGATYAKRLARGDRVHAAVMCEGESVRYTPQNRNVGQQVHARKAAKTLGFTSFRCLMLPDQRLDACSQIDLNQKIEAILDELRPSIVYTHCPGDINRDHQVTHESVMVATRPGRDFICEVIGFETPSTTGLWNTQCFQPDTFTVVDDTLDKKLAAMACYETETNTFPHPRSVDSLRLRAHYWGSIIQQVAAEPFMTLRRIDR